MNEVYFTAFHRVLGKYDEEENKSDIFTAALLLAFLVFSGGVLKYISLSYTILTANKNIHEKML